MRSNYNKHPYIEVSKQAEKCSTGWTSICNRLNEHIATLGEKRVLVVIDCYHGVLHDESEEAFKKSLKYDSFINVTKAFKSPEEVKAMVFPDVTDDRIFGFVTKLTIDSWFDEKKVSEMRDTASRQQGVIVAYGEGAAHVFPQSDAVVYLDMARWEIQLRMRRKLVDNLGEKNRNEEFPRLYKQAFFVDWRVLDAHKVSTMDKWDFLVDTNKAGSPKMVRGADVLSAIQQVTKQPFRVVPFFDPGPWGGQWLKEVADLDRSAVNYAWAFDCVPEENSLLLKFGNETIEIPSIDVVYREPEALLGKRVYDQFGAEFPIRFDFLDTIDGGNLSLQVHPTNEYIRENFGMKYTQDESYYMLDAKEGSVVYLGLKDDADSDQMISDLKKAQNDGVDFDADKYVNRYPVEKHDHYLIPAGTVHCSGKDSVVLEISATPYNFTFKLWDWGRLGLDGKPRPINIEHGEKVIAWDRREDWTRRNLVNRVEKVSEGDGWVEERTGLHETQFIETRRHWFTGKVPHNTGGVVNVLNLVEGKEAIIESPEGKFAPFVVHYAETFIVPAAVGDYTIRPYGAGEGTRCGTLKAFVKTSHGLNGHRN